MSDYYVLVDRTPIAADMYTWSAFMAQGPDSRRVAATDLGEGVSVSTVFLGMDHAWGGGQPLLFETMVFGGPGSDWQWRYHTWDAAQAGHDKVVAALREGVDVGTIEVTA
jgi:hypothetical protein